jgi:hypothetical protein
MGIKPVTVLLVGEGARNSLQLLRWLKPARMQLPSGSILEGCLQSSVLHTVRPSAQPAPTAGPNRFSLVGLAGVLQGQCCSRSR